MLPGLAVGVAFVAAGLGGFLFGSMTGSPEPASATEPVTTAPASTAPGPVSSAPLPVPLDDSYVAALDDSLQTGSETLAEGQSDVKHAKIPVTSFLTQDAAQGNYEFFQGVSAYDAVQNHSKTHQALSAASTDREAEICDVQDTYETRVGTRPWILRPPFGAGFMPRRSAADAIEKVAASCGIKHIALWNVTVDKNGKMEFAGEKFQRGDIVLLHFEGDLKAHLQMLVKEYGKRGLKPASLSEYLPA